MQKLSQKNCYFNQKLLFRHVQLCGIYNLMLGLLKLDIARDVYYRLVFFNVGKLRAALKNASRH
jgi:hypothetical protein